MATSSSQLSADGAVELDTRDDNNCTNYNTTSHPSTEAAQPAHSRRASSTQGDDGRGDANAHTSPEFQLQPADHGAAAWKLLWATFVFEALLWGFPLSFGVFQDYYSRLPAFANDPYVSIVGTVASGISYMGAPLSTMLLRRYSRYRRHMIWAGWPLCILGLALGSFATTLPILILTQGVMYGVGFLIFYYPIISMVEEFWVARRGMAYGILCGASGASGTVMPVIIQALLRRYGYATTLRAMAVGLALLTGPLIPSLKGRLPDERVAAGGGLGRRTTTDWSFLRVPLFWIYTASNVIQGLGYFFPSLFLPSYATSIGLSAVQGALLLTVMSVAQVLGQFSFGYLSDGKVGLNVLIVVSMVMSSLATLTLWGLARSFAPLLVFAMFFGFFAAGYTAMWARMVSAVSREPSAAMAMFSVFCFGKGVGNILAGPISAGLIRPVVRVGAYGAVKYETVVVFTGSCMLLSAVSVGAWYLKPKR